MKTMIVALCALASFTAQAGGSHYVPGHVTKNGTYVDGHFKTSPNDTKLDNYSTKGNVNPYTGQAGTKDPWTTPTPTVRDETSPSLYAPPKPRQPKY